MSRYRIILLISLICFADMRENLVSPFQAHLPRRRRVTHLNSSALIPSMEGTEVVDLSESIEDQEMKDDSSFESDDSRAPSLELPRLPVDVFGYELLNNHFVTKFV